MFKICISLSFLVSVILCDVHIRPISTQKWVQPYSPYWDPTTQSLFLVDFMNGTFIKYNDATKQISLATLPISAPSFLIKLTRHQHQFLISDHLSAPVVEWDGSYRDPKIIRETFSVESGLRFAANNWNIAKASPKGTFLGGTFRGSICSNSSAPPAGLYSYRKNYGVQKVNLPNLKSSSGIAWNTKGDVVYHVSSCERVIRAFNYNLETGTLSNGRIIFVYKRNYGDPIQSVPLGLTIDTAGYLYLAIYYGGVVLKINPNTGDIVKAIYIPAEIVTAVEFGGRNLDKLFVCTASKAFDINTGKIAQKTFSPDSGKVFVVTGLGAVGIPRSTISI